MVQGTNNSSKSFRMENNCSFEVYVAKAPRTRTVNTKNGEKSVTSFRGVNHVSGTRQAGLEIEGWDDLAVKAATVAVGDKVRVQGELTTEFNEKDGKSFYTTKLTINSIRILSKKADRAAAQAAAAPEAQAEAIG